MDIQRANFSVLMSLYVNEDPKFLLECLDSLSKQELLPAETVIVYDGPVTMELESICLSFKAALNIKFIKIESNVGLGRALQTGLENCSFDLVARMDTDDICKPERFRMQYKFMSDHPEVSILGSSIKEFFNNNSFRDKILPCKFEEVIKFAKKKNPLNHMTVMFRKSDVISVGGYKHHLFMEDYNLWLRMISAKKNIFNMSEFLVFARVGNGMVKKRRGFKYIISEVELFRLKRSLEITNVYESYYYFLIRVFPRLLPSFLLALLYKLDRK